MYERIYCLEQIDELVERDPDITLIYEDMEDFVESHVISMTQSLIPRVISIQTVEYFMSKKPNFYLINPGSWL